MHFGAVVADAPSPFSTPARSAAGQAQLRLGQPLCIALGQAPTLSGTQEEESQGLLGLSGLRSLFHGEHDAQEPTKVTALSADRAGGAQARSLPNFNKHYGSLSSSRQARRCVEADTACCFANEGGGMSKR